MEVSNMTTNSKKSAEDYLEPEMEPQIHLMGEKSPGVARVEAINAHLTLQNRIWIGVGVLLIAYAYGLDSSVRFTFQTYALNTFAEHSLISTVNTVRTVIAAAAQPTAAKIADVFGRVELIYFSIIFYVIGTVICAAATNVGTFAGGAILYQIGYTVVTLLVEVIVADISSLRSRLFWSYISVTPFLINTWIGGNVTADMLAGTSMELAWKWGIGMWAIIYPVAALPLMISLWVAARRAKKAGALVNYQTPYKQHGLVKLCVTLFWQLDIIGIILMIAMFALILVPFTLAGGESTTWGTAHIIAPLVVGFCTIPVFVIWERYAVHPLVPFRLLKDRGVWGALGIAWILDFAWYMQGDYLYTLLIVGFDQSVLSATRIASLYSFVSTLTGFGLSFVIRFGVPYLKPFIVFGACMFMVAFGLLIEFRGGSGSGSYSGIVGSQVFLGFSAGFFTYPAQVSIQSVTKHEHLALVTGLYLAVFNIGSAFGTTVSGAVWTQTLPGKLNQNLAAVGASQSVADSAYAEPYTFIVSYPVGTPERTAVINAYRDTQRLLCIVGICLCAVVIFFSLCLRNPRLTKEQSLSDAEESSVEMSARDEGGEPKKKPSLLRRMF